MRYQHPGIYPKMILNLNITRILLTLQVSKLFEVVPPILLAGGKVSLQR